jgi:hypothetical protein
VGTKGVDYLNPNHSRPHLLKTEIMTIELCKWKIQKLKGNFMKLLWLLDIQLWNSGIENGFIVIGMTLKMTVYSLHWWWLKTVANVLVESGNANYWLSAQRSS